MVNRTSGSQIRPELGFSRTFSDTKIAAPCEKMKEMLRELNVVALILHNGTPVARIDILVCFWESRVLAFAVLLPEKRP